MILIGVPNKPAAIDAFSLIGARRSLSGWLMGGIKETQEMLDFCGQHGIVGDIELVPVQQVNQAFDRMLRSDVRYGLVIDMASF